jgi:hypothetical protein
MLALILRGKPTRPLIENTANQREVGQAPHNRKTHEFTLSVNRTYGRGLGVGLGLGLGLGVAVGLGVRVAVGIAVGVGEGVGLTVGVGVGVD